MFQIINNIGFYYFEMYVLSLSQNSKEFDQKNNNSFYQNSKKVLSL